ncbi:hypothetical protein FXF51_06205 [Nonomuraea sp. PA05]|uniref:hypothetical protein n=1 Tax=Nonomuraea sp. PA05 TaxID=2604466 RepID=UPI0011D83D37|nr:hypothetical protein [Nonomuraea sp. PA05]TYB69753.1 hypothetical protein FXF51_06205 [Nonomuraea sp. PA05]
MPDVYPTDLTQRIRDLEKAVEELRAGASREALTEASQGWVLREMATPSVPPTGDIHIYAQGGQLYARSSFGTIALNDQAKAGFVQAVGAANAGTTYTTSEQDLLNQLKDRVNLIITNMKIAGLMDTI